MTCIVGIEKNGTVWIGGDSAGTGNDLSQRLIADSKVFKKDEFVFGVCGLPKVMDHLRYNIELPLNDTGVPDREFVASQVVSTIKEGLLSGGCVEGSGGQEHFQGAILFGYNGKLYNLQANFQVITNAYGFESVGSGSDIAIGSLHSSKNKWSTRKRIVGALEAACINNAGCRPPFTIVKAK